MTEDDVLQIVDACFHNFDSYHREEAEELAKSLISLRKNSSNLSGGNKTDKNKGVLENGSWFIFGKGETETVVITKKEYESLIEDQMFVRALEMAGVDNWEGYDIAIDHFDDLKNSKEDN